MIDLEAIAERDRRDYSHKRPADPVGLPLAASLLYEAVQDRHLLLEHVRELKQKLALAQSMRDTWHSRAEAHRSAASAAEAELDRLTDQSRLRPRSEWTESEGEVLWYGPHTIDGAAPHMCAKPCSSHNFTHFMRLPPVPESIGGES